MLRKSRVSDKLFGGQGARSSVQPAKRAARKRVAKNVQLEMSGTKDAVQNGERKTGMATVVLWQTRYIRQHCVECEQFPLR